jgi:hypothetical protein
MYNFCGAVTIFYRDFSDLINNPLDAASRGLFAVIVFYHITKMRALVD